MAGFILILNYQLIKFHRESRQIKEQSMLTYFNPSDAETQLLLSFKHSLMVRLLENQQSQQKILECSSDHLSTESITETSAVSTFYTSGYLGFSTCAIFSGCKVSHVEKETVAQCSYQRTAPVLHMEKFINSLLIGNHMPMLSHKYAYIYASVFDKEKECSGSWIPMNWSLGNQVT